MEEAGDNALKYTSDHSPLWCFSCVSSKQSFDHPVAARAVGPVIIPMSLVKGHGDMPEVTHLDEAGPGHKLVIGGVSGDTNVKMMHRKGEKCTQCSDQTNLGISWAPTTH